MSNPDTMRRLLVAVEASPRSRAMLEQAAALARAIEAELAGLFVEDVNLLRLCGLPGHEIALSSGMARRLEQATMERELRAQAEELRRLLEMVAQAPGNRLVIPDIARTTARRTAGCRAKA